MLYLVENYKVEIPVDKGIKYKIYSTEFTSTPFALNNPIIFIPTTSLNDKPTPKYEWSTNKLTLTCSFTNNYIFIEQVGVVAWGEYAPVTLIPSDITAFQLNTNGAPYNCIVQQKYPWSTGMLLTTSSAAPPDTHWGVFIVKTVNYTVYLEEKMPVILYEDKIAAISPYVIKGVVYH